MAKPNGKNHVVDVWHDAEGQHQESYVIDSCGNITNYRYDRRSRPERHNNHGGNGKSKRGWPDLGPIAP